MALITEIRRKLPLLKTQSPEDRERADGEAAAIVEINIDDIIPNRSQPRSTFNQNAIVRLADSIRRYGILQPLTVRKVLLPAESTKTAPFGQKNAVIYELVAGERRLRAAKLAELTHVPCVIINTDDATSAELAIIENLLRENLNMFEQAEAFARLIREFHLTQDEAARRVSMSQSAVANKLRILRLTPEERAKILEAGLTERHARALLKLSDVSLRGDVLQQILDRKMNVSATEAYIDHLLTEMARYEAKKQQNAHKMPVSTAEAVSEACETSVAAEPDGRTADEDTTDPDELPSAIQGVITQRRARFKGCIKDLQVFYNSIHNAVGLLESVGIEGAISKQESENEVKLTIVLTKAEQNECFT